MPATAKPSASANNICTDSGVINRPQRNTGAICRKAGRARASQSLTNGKRLRPRGRRRICRGIIAPDSPAGSTHWLFSRRALSAPGAHPNAGDAAGHSPLTGAAHAVSPPWLLSPAVYVAYVLWPRWPDAPVALDAPSLPIVIAGIVFNIEPAAIRMQRPAPPGHAGARRPRLSVAVAGAAGSRHQTDDRRSGRSRTNDCSSPSRPATATLPLIERVQTIYPRYLVAGAGRGSGRAHVARFSRRHALSGRGAGVRVDRARAFSGALLAQGRHQFRCVPAGAAHRQCRHHFALSARLADRLAKRRERHRPPDRAIASELTDPLLGVVLKSTRSTSRIGNSKI